MERIFKQLKEYAVIGRAHSDFINEFVTENEIKDVFQITSKL